MGLGGKEDGEGELEQAHEASARSTGCLEHTWSM